MTLMEFRSQFRVVAHPLVSSAFAVEWEDSYFMKYSSCLDDGFMGNMRLEWTEKVKKKKHKIISINKLER